MRLRLALLPLLLLTCCVGGDTGVNPPPRRGTSNASTATSLGARTERPLAASTRLPGVAAKPTTPSLLDPTLALGLRSESGTTQAAASDRPIAREDRDPGRFDRIGAQDVIAIQLLDRLPAATVTSPLLTPGFQVLQKSLRSYPNPWASGPNAFFDQRVVWTDGRTNQSSLRAALVVPVPASVAWPLTLPAGAHVRFDVAIGTRVSATEAVTVTVRVKDGTEETEVWSREVTPSALHKLREWTPCDIDVSAYGGRPVTLLLDATGLGSNGSGYRYTAFFAEPVVVTRALDEATLKAARDSTGLDVAENVLLIVNDAQRADTVKPVRTRLPKLFSAMEGLAESGAGFKRAFSVGNQTRISTFAFLAGQTPSYGRFHHVRWNFTPAMKQAFYAGDPPLLPRLLRQLGYRTVGIANNLFLFGNIDLSLDGGFDRFIDHRHGTQDTAWITESATSWIREHKEERWFMMLNYNTPHQPYVPPEESFGAFKPKLDGVQGYDKRYLGEVKWADENMAKVLAVLDELGLSGKTLVILTSDHGEIMDPRHECWNENWQSKCLHQHGKTLFDEEIHVPLVMRLPGRIPAGRVLHRDASHLDLPPTVLGLLGVRPVAGFLGRDLSGAVLGGAEHVDVPIVVEARLSSGVRWKGFKYILHDRRERMEFDRKTLFDARRGLEELYDLTKDPEELTNLAWDATHPALRTSRETLAALKRDFAKRRGGVETTFGENDAAEEDESEPVEDKPAPALAAAPARSVPLTAVPPRVRNTLLFHRGGSNGRFTGLITTTERFTALEKLDARPGNACQLLGSTEIRVDVRAEDAHPTGIRFRTTPEDAPVTFAVLLDGFPVTADLFYVGAYGLELYKNPLTVTEPSAWQLAFAPHGGPVVVAGEDAGVFFWRDGLAAPGAPAESADIEGEGSIDPQIRDIMKDWGYIGK